MINHAPLKTGLGGHLDLGIQPVPALDLDNALKSCAAGNPSGHGVFVNALPLLIHRPAEGIECVRINDCLP